MAFKYSILALHLFGKATVKKKKEKVRCILKFFFILRSVCDKTSLDILSVLYRVVFFLVI